jgi:flagellar biosynthetic protein FliQ
VLAVTLIVGVLAAMLQAVTSIRDMTLGVILKLAAVGVTLLVAGGWMLQVTTAFTTEIFNHVAMLGH